MRARNPCLRLRRRTFGWYVRFTAEKPFGGDVARGGPPRRSAEYR
jgi:hypothetical protein